MISNMDVTSSPPKPAAIEGASFDLNTGYLSLVNRKLTTENNLINEAEENRCLTIQKETFVSLCHPVISDKGL